MSDPRTEVSPAHDDEGRNLHLSVLSTLGIHLPRTARILDFGCGAGRDVDTLRAAGYTDAVGYDVADGRTLVRTGPEHITVTPTSSSLRAITRSA